MGTNRMTLVSVMVTAAVFVAGVLCSPVTMAAKDPVLVGYIGSFDSDSGKSTIRGAEIAIEELNAAGGVLGGRQIKLVKEIGRASCRERV